MSILDTWLRAYRAEDDAPPARPFHYGARLVTTALFLPVAAIVCTVILFLALPDPYRPWAAALGLGAAAILCAVAALFCHFVDPKHGIPTSYAELLQRLERLRALERSLELHPTIHDAAAYLEAKAQMAEIGIALRTSGMRWVLGHGYTDAWARLHRAEEALIELAPLDDVFEGAEYDELRLSDSAVPNRDALTAKLRKAIEGLRAAADGRESTPLPFIRSTLRNVRRAINEYRDQRWNGLIVARNRLFETCALTAAMFFAIMATAIAGGATKSQMIAATFFCAIGAAVGLGKRLRDDARADSAPIDEGLSAARLITIPLFSGFAAICGVALTALLPSAETLSFATVFDATASPKNFLVAAIFGLAPDLLFDNLQQRAEKFKKELTSSDAAGEA